MAAQVVEAMALVKHCACDRQWTDGVQGKVIDGRTAHLGKASSCAEAKVAIARTRANVYFMLGKERIDGNNECGADNW